MDALIIINFFALSFFSSKKDQTIFVSSINTSWFVSLAFVFPWKNERKNLFTSWWLRSGLIWTSWGYTISRFCNPLAKSSIFEIKKVINQIPGKFVSFTETPRFTLYNGDFLVLEFDQDFLNSSSDWLFIPADLKYAKIKILEAFFEIELGHVTKWIRLTPPSVSYSSWVHGQVFQEQGDLKARQNERNVSTQLLPASAKRVQHLATSKNVATKIWPFSDLI